MSQALAQGLLELIPPELSPLLERFQVPGTPWSARRSSGQHRSPIRGQSVEFFEHRDYSHGDDPRRIDWRASAKGDRTLVRFGEREQKIPVYIFLDNHAGMAYGEKDPPQRWSWARGVAALLAHSALGQGDPVSLVMSPQDLGPASTRGSHIARLCHRLAEPPTASSSQLRPCLQAWSKVAQARGRVFFISDWLDLSDAAQDHDQAAQALFHMIQELPPRGHTTWGLELLHHDELELRFSTKADAISFIDPTARRPSQIGDPDAMREPYLRALDEHRRALAQRATQAQMHWCPMRSDQPWANALHAQLGTPKEAR